jgi:hypothetical protein
MTIPWIAKPKPSSQTAKKSVCALLLSKDKWKELSQKEFNKNDVQSS